MWITSGNNYIQSTKLQVNSKQTYTAKLRDLMVLTRNGLMPHTIEKKAKAFHHVFHKFCRF